MINPANFAHALGRLTADPDVRTTSSGVNYCHFTIAVDRGYAKPGEEKQTDFIDCSAWRSSAEFLGKYFKKGNVIEVVGAIETRTYEDKDGRKRKATEINCEKISFVPGAKSNGSETAAAPAPDHSKIVDDSDGEEGFPF